MELSDVSARNVILIALVCVVGVAQSVITTAASPDQDLTDALSSTPSTAIFPCKQISRQSLDCSNLGLSAIPKNIPSSILQLNLSQNSLQPLSEDAFDDCCGQILVLDLSSNNLSAASSGLTQRHFQRLGNMETLYLSSNDITNLHPETFSSLKRLKKLDLSRNKLQLEDETFLFQSSIEELNLDFCDISQIPHDAFLNMSQLKNLTLAGNLFDENIDTSAFEPLRNLLRLRINNLSKSSIYELCEKLVAIDIVSFDEYNVSCTVLSDDQPFEESIISNDPVEEPRIDSVISPPVTTAKSTVAASTTSSSSIHSTLLPTVIETSTLKAQPNLNDTSDEMFTNKTRIDTDTASIDVDDETIKIILVGIFGLTVFGILVGLICRGDICGIKTKMCRSQKNNNRREPADALAPFEEIPLNGISVNGKSPEVQGASKP